MNFKPILIVHGEPNSVFLEIFFKSLKNNKFKNPLILICSQKILKFQMKKLKFKMDVKKINQSSLNKIKLNNNLSLSFYFNRSYFHTSIAQEEIKTKQIIPFRGPINHQTLSCAEDLRYKLIQNDKYGFKNSYGKMWEDFINDPKYYKYFIDNYTKWKDNLISVKKY